MNFNTFLDSVVNIKHLPLLGEEAHRKLSPPYRLELAEKYKEKRKTASKAGVMALFYPDVKETTHVVFILRKTYKGVHSAQVGFPGGKVEDIDNNLMETALRETEEEIGVPVKQIEVLKTLSPLYIPPSNFIVHPFLGVSKQPLTFTKQDEEVEAVIEVRVNEILEDQNLITTKVPTSYNVDVEVPAFRLNNYIVWGATAMMLSEIKVLLKQIL
ncbi:8-oxo-dGTP pyrophosphatase MutT (NUDIX family) [Winogradskyella wandonensis]|uniref:8-oxo-dGTP pyrophosphatase MutT (NUDIX family) n=1 Tax=Winogradskyella wandonensis TaxID=1442586 RepID=A0A4R1KNS5_9FLAO|nr:CoA pyrophosphatase [Winogradskyella wandonensis]TCK66662.1 8-oxo-dGTP pyrophosphatase MutT (NUDIX family) [Winogradskyella wandonensis]